MVAKNNYNRKGNRVTMIKISRVSPTVIITKSFTSLYDSEYDDLCFMHIIASVTLDYIYVPIIMLQVGGREELDIHYPCGSIPWESLVWLHAHKIATPQASAWSWLNIFVSSSNMVSKCNIKQSIIKMAPLAIPCDVLRYHDDCWRMHAEIARGSLSPAGVNQFQAQWPGGHCVLGYRDRGSLNPGGHWSLWHQYNWKILGS